MNRVLVMGRKPGIVAAVSAKYGDLGVTWCEAGTLEDVETALGKHPDITVAIMGAGLDDQTQGALIALIATMRPDISIHLKDRRSGPAGMAPFVRNIVRSGVIG